MPGGMPLAGDFHMPALEETLFFRGKGWRPVVFGLLLSALLFAYLALVKFSTAFIVLPVALSFLLLVSLAGDIVSTVLVVLLFVNQGMWNLSLSALFPFMMLLFVAFASRRVSLRELPMGVWALVCVFMAAALLSTVNSIDKTRSISMAAQLVSFLATIVAVFMLVSSYRIMKRIIIVFITLNCANSLAILCMAMQTGSREFGFAGIWFVDFAGLGIIMATTCFFSSSGWKKVGWLAAACLQAAGLFATQTRNPIMVLGLVGATVVIALLGKSRQLLISRKTVLSTSAITALIAALLLGLALISSGQFKERFSKTTLSARGIRGASDIGGNSLLTRVLIWDTAINAFKAHPFIGIGIYSFPIASRKYYTFHDVLYTLFVKGFSPHVAYLTALCETGILGLAAFIAMMLSFFRVGLRNLDCSHGPQEKRYSIMLFALVSYIMFSCAVTDAWFYSHAIVLFGIIAGLTGAQHRIVRMDRSV
jgi:O-antigen ligase